MAGSPEMHSWHCDCNYCDGSDPYPFHFQRDSTCSGEVISKVLNSNDMTEALYLMLALQQGALEVDAVPGLTSGLHVHVDQGPLARARLFAQALRVYVTWEQTLSQVAAGRWLNVREGQNVSINRILRREGHDVYFYDDDDLFDCIYEADRHAWLCVNTRHDTWEFRLWNSTRAAWRMEMFARLSLAFMAPAFVERLYGHEATPSVALLADLLDAHDRRAASLVRRQLTYIETVAPTVGSEVA